MVILSIAVVTSPMLKPINFKATTELFEIGNSFLTYSARDNNCQNFVLSLLQANGLSRVY